MEAVVYIIENNINYDCYIGSSTNYYRRKKRHFTDLGLNKHHSPKLQRAYNKYGKDCFNIYILESFLFVSKSDILAREQFYIDTMKPKYNICNTAGSQLGSIRSDEFKANCSKRMKGKTPWNKGLKLPKHSIELTKKRSESLKGRRLSEATKNKIKDKVSKPVLQYDSNGVFIKEWQSLKEVSLFLPCSYSKLSNYINGKNNINTFKNYIWKLKT